MGKVTFRRVVNAHRRQLQIAALPIGGGLLFLVGSFCFWPGLGHVAVTAGALCFMLGSLLFWAAPLLDFYELTHNYSNLLEPPLDPTAALSGDISGVAALYEHLYKSHILRVQMANCLIYTIGGAFFVAGSALFFPEMEEIIYHGGWLYITGCMLMLAGALLALLTAFELRRTALPLQFVAPPPRYLVPFWSDEQAQIASCSLYVAGNVVFILGSVLFFPRVLEAAADAAVVVEIVFVVAVSDMLEESRMGT